MANIQITCDSTCDLTADLYRQNAVEVVPLSIALGEESRLDGVNVTADELFEFVARTGTLPKTAGISLGEYEEVFRKYVDAGNQVIHINLSSELSVSHQNARLAAEEVENVHVVDSRSLSTGSGLLVLLASEMARKGMDAPAIVAELNRKKQLLDVSFIIQTLEYLHKGGRCSGVAAFGANVLKLRPEIQVQDGKMVVGKKYRGDAEKSTLAYIRGRLEGRQDVDPELVFITHSGVDNALLEKAEALVKELQPFKQVIVTRAGCTISSHCGPGCLGVLFFRKESE